MYNMKNKVVVITGASGGLGEAMAVDLSKHGAKVVIWDIKNGQKVVKKLKTKSKFYKVDISDEDSIKQTIKLVKKEFGKIDVLINNAGIFYPTPISSTTKESWEKMMSVNVTGYFLTTKYCIPLMKKGSKIINISSVAGHHAFAGSSAYNASKGAVIMLTKTMAIEYAKKGINVNAICPGMFITPMTKDTINDKTTLNTIKNSILLGRAGKSKEISGLVRYLSSDECSYMTGSIIDIDGGWTCHL